MGGVTIIWVGCNMGVSIIGLLYKVLYYYGRVMCCVTCGVCCLSVKYMFYTLKGVIVYFVRVCVCYDW